jgi:hypothetical protein
MRGYTEGAPEAAAPQLAADVMDQIIAKGQTKMCLTDQMQHMQVRADGH